MPFRKFLQLNSFCNSFLFATHDICLLEVSAIHSISQRFAIFCNVIATFAAISLIFATLLQPFLFCNFLTCNYWQNALSLPILFIAFIMQKFYHAIYKDDIQEELSFFCLYPLYNSFKN